MTLQTVNANLKPLGYQQLSAATLASATLLTAPVGATIAVVNCNPTATAVRYRDDGTAPTSTTGVVLAGLSTLTYTGDLTKIQFILSTGSPILDILYYGNA